MRFYLLMANVTRLTGPVLGPVLPQVGIFILLL